MRKSVTVYKHALRTTIDFVLKANAFPLAPVCTNGIWPPLRPVSVVQKNKPSTMLSSNVQSIDVLMVCLTSLINTSRIFALLVGPRSSGVARLSAARGRP